MKMNTLYLMIFPFMNNSLIHYHKGEFPIQNNLFLIHVWRKNSPWLNDCTQKTQLLKTSSLKTPLDFIASKLHKKQGQKVVHKNVS
jgi:hypothetical protein